MIFPGRRYSVIREITSSRWEGQRSPEPPEDEEGFERYADRYCQVVQQFQRIWIYYTERRQPGCVRAFFIHRDRRLQIVDRGTDGGIRILPGTERHAGQPCGSTLSVHRKHAQPRRARVFFRRDRIVLRGSGIIRTPLKGGV